jgi:PTS system galactitol-specific IIC component
MFTEIMRYILDLGPTVMLPIVIIIFSKLLGMKLGDCFKSGLHIGIGFVGIGLVIGLMLDSIGPAAKAMAEHFQINLHVVDVGWPGSSPMTWASQIALVAIPVAIGVNVVMLVTRMTRVVNVDIWNIWHMTFTGAMLHLATGSYWLGILGVVVHAAFVYKLGDWFAKDTRDFFGLEGLPFPTVHRPTSALSPCWSIRLSRRSRGLIAFISALMTFKNASARLANRSPSASSWGWLSGCWQATTPKTSYNWRSKPQPSCC